MFAVVRNQIFTAMLTAMLGLTLLVPHGRDRRGAGLPAPRRGDTGPPRRRAIPDPPPRARLRKLSAVPVRAHRDEAPLAATGGAFAVVDAENLAEGVESLRDDGVVGPLAALVASE